MNFSGRAQTPTPPSPPPPALPDSNPSGMKNRDLIGSVVVGRTSTVVVNCQGRRLQSRRKPGPGDRILCRGAIDSVQAVYLRDNSDCPLVVTSWVTWALWRFTLSGAVSNADGFGVHLCARRYIAETFKCACGNARRETDSVTRTVFLFGEDRLLHTMSAEAPPTCLFMYLFRIPLKAAVRRYYIGGLRKQ